MKINQRYNELLQKIREVQRSRKNKIKEGFVPWQVPDFVYPKNIGKQEAVKSTQTAKKFEGGSQ